MNGNWEFALTLGAIIAGIFFNQHGFERVRSELMGELKEVRKDLGDIKVRVAVIESRLGIPPAAPAAATTGKDAAAA